jgi:hypothetical protein
VRPAIRDIAKAAADHFEIPLGELRFGSRKMKYCWPRQIAMALCRYMGDRSYPEIASYFGKKHHTTAMNAFDAVDKVIDDDDETFRDLMAIAAHATGLSTNRQVEENECVQFLRSLQPMPKLPTVDPSPPRRIVVPERSPVRARYTPVLMPSEFAPPSLARLMGARA